MAGIFGNHHHRGHRHSQQSADLTNPRIPLTWNIGDITEGLSIVIDGYAPHNSERFSINLQRGTLNDNSSDIIFHFNPRFGQREVVRNARFNGSWGPEEKHGSMPIIKNRRFQLQILVEPQHFTVQIDGRTFCHFPHRAAFGMANTLTAEGNLVLNKVTYRRAFNPTMPTMPVYPGFPTAPTYPTGCIPPPVPGPYPGPETFLPNPPPYPGPPGMPGPIVKPELPLVTQIPGGFTVGKSIVINANVKPHANRFKINLQIGAQSYPPPDVALHFNPRYDDHQVVLNTKINNGWGREERSSLPMGLQQRGNVEIRITSNPQDYHIFVNNQFFAAYSHRIPHNRFPDTLDVEGDMTINSVNFF